MSFSPFYLSTYSLLSHLLEYCPFSLSCHPHLSHSPLKVHICPGLFFLLNNLFKIIPFLFVLHLVRSANTAAWLRWMWAGTSLPHALILCWSLISQPPTVQRSLHYCSTSSIDHAHQMWLLTPLAPSIYPPAPGMVMKSMSSYCRLSQTFFHCRRSPSDHRLFPPVLHVSLLLTTSIKLQHGSFSLNIVWQFKSLPPEFQLYREKNTISYLSHIDSKRF